MPKSKARPAVDSTSALARHLGLSRWTVSRALNGHPDVNPETAARVQAAARESGFVPSPFARGLRGGRTGTIGIAFRELETPILVRKVAHMQTLLRTRQYRPLFELTEASGEVGLDVIQHFVAMRVEGVILVDASAGPDAAVWRRLLDDHGIPAVFLEPRGIVSENAVSLDRAAAMQRVTEQLWRLGHRHFALLGIDRSYPLGVPRVDGVAAALRAHGASFEDCVEVIMGSNRRFDAFDYGRELADYVLGLPALPTALLALNDEIATGALWRLQQAGVSVPRDVSLFGFDNLPIGLQTSPRLCTVDQQVTDMIEATVSMLFALLDAPPGKRILSRQLPTQIVLRDSVAAPAIRVAGFGLRPRS